MPTHDILPATNVRSLVWSGDALIDWVGGAASYGLDGSVAGARVQYPYRFDMAVASPDGLVAVIYEQRGTKGLVLEQGEVLREINRSFYHADVYDYPICLWTNSGGRTLMAHCPDDYCTIEIEDSVTGQRLTTAPDRNPADFFHSRLQVNPGGTRLLSAGWVWHPLDTVHFFDLSEALATPASLDSVRGSNFRASYAGLVEESSACWQSDDRLLISGGSVEEEPEEESEGALRLHGNGIIAYDVPSASCVSSAVLEEPAGIMMPVGDDRAVVFYKHPRLILLADGSVIEQWPELSTGDRTSSIRIGGAESQPPLALDPKNRRYAVFAEDGIHVVSVA